MSSQGILNWEFILTHDKRMYTVESLPINQAHPVHQSVSHVLAEDDFKLVLILIVGCYEIFRISFSTL